MFGRALLRFALTLPACALALAGCGGDERQPDPRLRGPQLTIYSSSPQRGPLQAVAADVLDAERLALEQEDGRVGRYRVRLIGLDASTLGAGRSDPAQMSQNARLAAENPRTVAYLGELATGSSAISIPLLNEAGILQVSPLDTAIALTTRSLAVAGSPERLYPKLREVGRTFARVVPSDRGQVDALLTDMRQSGVRRLAILTDEDPSGRAIATNLRAKAREAGIAVVAREEIDEHAPRHDDEIARIGEAHPDGVLDATGARPGASRLWRQLHATDPRLKLFAPAHLADPSFVAGLGPAAAVAHVTQPILAEGDDTRAAWAFARAFARRYGHAPDPKARYGYEAMRSVLDAIRRAGRRAPGGLITRAAVVRAYFETAPRTSVLGPYAIDAAGDTTLDDWGAYRVVDGHLPFAETLSGGRGGASGQR
ncbi:MAG TPA: ABC transporter substrate-binding protein [Conexibacter sp.]|nr:ABC transporter substrate-binding protein [Conexibacter sp.]